MLDNVIKNSIQTTILPDDLKDEIAQEIHKSKIQIILSEIKNEVKPFHARETFDHWIQNSTYFYRMNNELRLFFNHVNYDWFRCEKTDENDTSCYDMFGYIKFVDKKNMRIVLYKDR